ncbi:NACHT domain-containing protein [Streptomyces sp. NBC_00299]|uniref:NACHT domain-containing protein n=1 Tax=Streptomyces sp. NBC_00299 TaxID=2975705 RepID=UPI002E2D474C|nr:NACHT domain-containing protein [Streptomyces sp. NBC_00299]
MVFIMWGMKSGRGRLAAWLYGMGAVLGFGVAALMLPGAKRGDIDPLSAVIALAGLSVSGWAGHLAWLSWRHQETDVAGTASRLAAAVLDSETRARKRLLGGHGRSIDLDFVYMPAPHHNALGARPRGSSRKVVAYYRRLRPGRLVITGPPGAGKTLLTLELILGLLQDRRPDDPVPVRLSLSSWHTLLAPASAARPGEDPVKALREWVCSYLVDSHRLSEAAAGALFDAGMVLPVLDGLDEMAAENAPDYTSQARRALDALNSYQRGLDSAKLVLTCRTEQYRALESARVWLKDAARVDISSVRPTRGRAFIESRTDDPARWAGVLDEIYGSAATPLAARLATPWRLTLAAVVYEQRDPATGAYVRDPRELVEPNSDGDRALRDRLLGLFVEAAVASHPAPRGALYSADQTRTWLRTLAVYLHRNEAEGRSVRGRRLSGTDVVPHALWPLAGTYLPRVVHCLVLAPVWVILPWLGVRFWTMLYSDLAVQVAVFLCTELLALWATEAWQAWPTMERALPRNLFSRSGARGLRFGCGWGLILGAVVCIPASFALELGLTFSLGAALWMTLFLTVWLGLGAMRLEDPQAADIADPRHFLRADVVSTLGRGVMVGLLVAPIVVFVIAPGLEVPVSVGLSWQLGVTLAFALVAASSAYRYFALLLCTRRGSRRLPWRLGAFLAWAESAGLLRVAGVAYQFRHRELQDWLVGPAQDP